MSPRPFPHVQTNPTDHSQNCAVILRQIATHKGLVVKDAIAQILDL